MDMDIFDPIPPGMLGTPEREYGFDHAAAHEAALEWMRKNPKSFMFCSSNRPVPPGFKINAGSNWLEPPTRITG